MVQFLERRVRIAFWKFFLLLCSFLIGYIIRFFLNFTLCFDEFIQRLQCVIFLRLVFQIFFWKSINEVFKLQHKFIHKSKILKYKLWLDHIVIIFRLDFLSKLFWTFFLVFSFCFNWCWIYRENTYNWKAGDKPVINPRSFLQKIRKERSSFPLFFY